MNFKPLPLIEPGDSKYFLLFETALPDKDNFKSYIFTNPEKIFKAYTLTEAEDCLKKLSALAGKYCAAGYLAYEAGYAFEERFQNNKRYDFPLLHVAAFKEPVIFNHRTGKFCKRFETAPLGKEGFKVSGLKFNENFATYKPKIEKIKKFIRNGDTYQVNFTGKLHFNFSGSPFAFYKSLKLKQPVAFSAFMKMDEETLLSLSPELFFKTEGRAISSRPMKGTIKRGRNIGEDNALIRKLISSPKERAENLMITDLIRNDLGKISETGSVKTSKIFEVERFNSLFQMTTTVKGRLKKNVKLYDIFKNLFPGGSITGAPKIRTMELIKELEKEPRQVYCGAIGFSMPGQRAVFNIPIRTVYLKGGHGQMGIGSGVTYGSSPKNEYNECLLKARFLSNKFEPFKILETILWNGSYFLQMEHLERMALSAAYFGTKFNKQEAAEILKNPALIFRKDESYRVRLLLDKDGGLRTEVGGLQETVRIGYVTLSKKRTNSRNRFLYHKTTNRDLYDSEYSKYRALGYTDCLFMNEKQELTEGAITNIFIEKDGRFFTPPLSSGLLPGIMRAALISSLKAKEQILHLKDLRSADRVYICNSVRGLIEVKIKQEVNKVCNACNVL